jgi:murein DD-endopeptidase MepM/ murein hydrolase activator NlpD
MHVAEKRRTRRSVLNNLAVQLTAIVALESGLFGLPSSADIAVPASGRVRPGDVMVFTAIASRPLDEARVDVFDHVVPMWSTRDRSHWMALIGVDVETPPGRYPAVVRALSSDGKPSITRASITITGKIFGTRRLLVDPKFSEPPAAERPRIEQESRRLAGIFATTSRERYWNRPFDTPVTAPTSSLFGVRSVFNGVPRSRHNGVDFAIGPGAPVRAPAAGRVVLSDALYFTGNTVIIDHGEGLYSLLAHLEKTAVHHGDALDNGDVVGLVGATGRATGPHLHWSIRLQGARVDPLSLIERTRALPR